MAARCASHGVRPNRVTPHIVEWPGGGSARPNCYRVTSGGTRTWIDGDRFITSVESETLVVHNTSFQLEGADGDIRLEGGGNVNERINSLRGHDTRIWAPALSAFDFIRARRVHAGVDVQWYFDQDGRLEYDFHLDANADPGLIVIRVDGAESLTLGNDGMLSIETPIGRIRHSAPLATEKHRNGESATVQCSYRLIDSSRFGFVVVGRSRDCDLRIDPGIAYATLVGGTVLELPAAIDVDSAGAVYITGRTGGDFPTTPGAFDTTFNGGLWGDAFVTKLDPTGGSLVFSTYVGGSGNEIAKALSVDASGCATIGILGGSVELPTTPGCYQSQTGGCYIARLDSTGSSIVLATNFGGSNTGFRGLAIDPQGNHCIAGEVSAPELPATPGAFSTIFGGGTSDGWAAKLNPTVSSLVFATYIGGSSGEIPFGLAIDSQGAMYLAGSTASVNYPIAGSVFQPTIKGTIDCFVSKVSSSGSALDYSTYLGGAQEQGAGEECDGIAVDKNGCAHVVGITSAPDFPLTPGGVDTGPPLAGMTTFVSKLAFDGSGLVYADRITSKASIGTVLSQSIVIDGIGNAVFCGATQPPFLSTPDALGYVPGGFDAFITILSPLGLGVTFSTLWGASKNDGFDFVRLDSQGNAYLLGTTKSSSFPTTQGAYDSTLADPAGDLTVVKMSLPNVPFGTATFGSGLPGCFGSQVLRTEASVKAASGTMTLECDDAPPNSLGLILVSDLQDVNGSDPLFLGVPFHVGLSPNMFGLNIVSGTTDPAFVTVPLPNLAGLVGSTFYFQAFWLWPQAICTPSPFGLSASNGLAVTVIP